jgi:predicted Zn-dependent protease
MNMEYRGIEYTVVQGIERRVWKWSAFAAGAQISGQESVRSAAVAAAESAIDLALADPRKPLFGKPVDEKQVHRDDPRAEELNSLRLALATFALKLDAFEARLKLRRGQMRQRATAPDLAADAAAVADVSLAKPDRARR